VIFVASDQSTSYGGSFYANSTLTGNWADFTAKDLVAYMDSHYRTIASRNSRGICGHSMGGHGALKLSMLFQKSSAAFTPSVPEAWLW
jgi:S-formylglutathione hydrolase FrmB